MRRGQRYRYSGTCDHVCRDGRRIQLIVLESRCAECGSYFRYKTTRRAMQERHFNRRCSLHRAPGTPVAQRKPKSTTGPPSAALTAPPLAPIELPPLQVADQMDWSFLD